MGRIRLKYTREYVDKTGRVRRYFRRGEEAQVPLPGHPGSVEYMEAYQSALEGQAITKIEPGKSRTKSGSISELIVVYYRSPEFLNLAGSTKKAYRSIIERFRAKHGDKLVAQLERRHVKMLIAEKAATPSAANSLLKKLKILMRFAIDIGMRKDDPTYGVKGFRIKGDGLPTWTEAEIAAFEKRHPIGSKARLAFALMLYLGQRRSDIVLMGRQHIEGNTIRVRQQKTDTPLKIFIHPVLANILSVATREDMTFLVTEYGKPFKPEGFGNWFRKRCDEAGLPKLAAHGLRKAAARRLAEAGCTDRQIMAVTGHKTTAEVTRYTQAADQELLAEQAISALPNTETEQTLANQPERLAKRGLNSLKVKE